MLLIVHHFVNSGQIRVMVYSDSYAARQMYILLNLEFQPPILTWDKMIWQEGEPILLFFYNIYNKQERVVHLYIDRHIKAM